VGAFLLADLGITKTHSRPYTAADNPYSAAWFKTLKYWLGFSKRFDSIEHARHWKLCGAVDGRSGRLGVEGGHPAVL
jgi:hypothetical protein